MRITRSLIIFTLLLCIFHPVHAAEPATNPNGIIALLTDYGTKDFYVGALKGVIYSLYPQATIVDITHQITPFDIREGALTLLLSAREFPPGTVFVGVVDPGVGTRRKSIVVETLNGQFFVGPDNGLFTMVIQEFGVKGAYQITNPAWMGKENISTSFHGRDIFAPVAARLASGEPIQGVGTFLTAYVTLPVHPPVIEGKKVRCEVIFIDRYGNVQVNADESLVNKIGINHGDAVTVTVKGRKKKCPWVNTYSDVPRGSLLLLKASTGFLEIAVNKGNAAKALRLRIGSRVTLEKR